MRFFIAGFMTETNTFAPFPTGRQGFEAMGLHFGDGSVTGTGLAAELARDTRYIIENAGDEAIESVFTFAQPSGLTLTRVYEDIRDRILSDLERARPVDAVLLWLHGAMVAVGYDDCEGDILSRVRNIVGDRVPVGAVLDPHAHLTSAMIQHADALVFMKEYPHTDGGARTRELFEMLKRAAGGHIRPTMAAFNLQMIGGYPTTSDPMRAFVDSLYEVEKQPGILSVSLVHGFPWGDVADVGTQVLVCSDGDELLAQRTAKEIGLRFYRQREQLRMPCLALDEALVRIRQLDGLVVAADISDNPGGGAPADNTAFLLALLGADMGPSALGALWDPVAVETCSEAGIGAAFELRIGGKAGRSSGPPADIPVTVEALSDDLVQHFFGGDQSLGRAARVSAGDVQMILCSKRVQVFSPSVFTALGVRLETLKLVVVKSTAHFEAGFGPLTEHIIRVDTGGALSRAFESIPYTKRNMAFWPKVADPLLLGS